MNVVQSPRDKDLTVPPDNRRHNFNSHKPEIVVLSFGFNKFLEFKIFSLTCSRPLAD